MTNEEFRREVWRRVHEQAERDRLSGYKPNYNYQQVFRSVSHDDSKGVEHAG